METIKVTEVPGLAAVIIGVVVLLAVGMAVVPGLLMGAWFFGVVVVGIVARTIFPWMSAILTTMKEESEFPTFKAHFYVPLVGALGLDLLAMLVYLLTTKDAIMEMTTFTFTLAFMVGYGGPQILRDGQKFIKAVRA